MSNAPYYYDVTYHVSGVSRYHVGVSAQVIERRIQALCFESVVVVPVQLLPLMKGEPKDISHAVIV